VTYRERLQKDLSAATKAGDKTRRDTIRLLLTALTNEEVALDVAELDEEQFVAVVQREAKKRRESIEAYREAGRQERAAAEEAELKVLGSYLPAQADEGEIESVVREIIDNLPGEPAMGPVMGQAMGRLKGKADGAVVRRVVERLLNA